MPVSRSVARSAGRSAGREAREGEAVPQGRIRGRLFPIEVGGTLPAECIVVLVTAGNVIAEAVRSGADGRFTSEREFPLGTVCAFVHDSASRDELARYEAPFDPEAEGEWLVPVVGRVKQGDRPVAHAEGEAWLRGQVVDLTARPVAGALVKGIPLDGKGERAAAASADSGEFELSGLEPGRYRVLVQGRFASATPLELTLVEGANEAGAVILPARPVAGAIEGHLVAEDGGVTPFGVLFLRDLESGKERVETVFSFFAPSTDEDGEAFAFPDVPAGHYELVLVALDGRSYEPEHILVEPPRSGLEFRASGPSSVGFRLRAHAEESGEALGFAYAALLHGQWGGEEVALGKEGEWYLSAPWIVWAEGRRPVRGEFPEPRGDETEPILLDIPLERGYGEVLLFKDASSDELLANNFKTFTPGLPGVTVSLDGQAAATSDANGLVLLDLARPPGKIEFGLLGWRTLSDDREEGIRIVHLVRE